MLAHDTDHRAVGLGVHPDREIRRLGRAHLVVVGNEEGNRAFEAPDITAAFADLERQLASPRGRHPHE